MTAPDTQNVRRIPMDQPGLFDADGFPLSIKRNTRHQDCSYHGHEFWELVIITAGEGIHVWDEEYRIQAGDVFVLNQNMYHGYKDTDELSLINILFDPDRLDMPTADVYSMAGYRALMTLEPRFRGRHQFSSHLYLSPTQRRKVIQWVDDLEDELSGERPGRQFVAISLFMQIVAYLSRCYEQMESTNAEALLRISHAITYMESHFQEPIRMEELAGMANMSESTLYRTFRESIGTSPTDYLIRLRIEHACKLLRNHSTSIGDIAAEVGIKDSNYFSRLFRKVIGCSPGTYRKRQAGQT